MASSPGSEAGLKDFSSSLSNLGAHPDAEIIAMLTGFADDLKTNSQRVLLVLTNRIRSVDITRKVPLLYLLDSIVKSRARNEYAAPFGAVAANLFLEVFQTVGDKDKLRMRKVLKTWRDMNLLSKAKSEPVWIHVQHFVNSNPERVAIAEGKRRSQPRSTSAPRVDRQPPVVPTLPNNNTWIGAGAGAGAGGYHQLAQDPFRQFVHQQQLAMGLTPKSLEELQMINPGLIHALKAHASAAPLAVAPPPAAHSHPHYSLHQPPPLATQPPHATQPLPSATNPSSAATSSAGGGGDDDDDDAADLLKMLGGGGEDSSATDTSAADNESTTAAVGGEGGAGGGGGVTGEAETDESTSTDVAGLFEILEGVRGTSSSGLSTSVNGSGGPRVFPSCPANLSQAFQGTTAQLLQRLQVRDEASISMLYRGTQDQKTGLRFLNQSRYEEQISFNYHITQRDKKLNQADLMRRWSLPFSHWIMQPAPYHAIGNEFIQYAVEQKMRDPYMTTKEAKQMASGGGVIIGGEGGSGGSSNAGLTPSLTELLRQSDGGAGGGAALNGNPGGTVDADGVYSIAVDQLLSHETKQCVVCQEVFESAFDDAADRWVYKHVRRVPAGLIHSHCWTPDAETFQQVESKKRSLVNEEQEEDESEPSLKRAKN